VSEAGDANFSGFPNSGLATVIPNLFFSQVLPQIESVEELVVSFYFFFAQNAPSEGNGRGRAPRLVTLRELEADRALAQALTRLSDAGAEALSRGLQLAVGRGTLVRAHVVSRGIGEEAFAVNSPTNRRALATLEGADLTLDEPLPPADGSTAPNIFALYEQNIGSITPLIADQLRDAEGAYPPEWIRDAFKEAVALNKRNWRYTERILRRWEVEGRDNEEAERDPEGEWLAERYARGKRRRPVRS